MNKSLSSYEVINLFIHYNDIIHSASEHIRYDDHVVYCRHAVAAHPLEYSLWCSEAAYSLNVLNLDIAGSHHVLNVCSGCSHVDSYHNRHFLSKNKRWRYYLLAVSP